MTNHKEIKKKKKTKRTRKREKKKKISNTALKSGACLGAKWHTPVRTSDLVWWFF